MNRTFNSIKDKVIQYLHLRFDEIRLEIVEKIVNVLGYFIFVILAIFFTFIGLGFLALSLAEWLIEIFDSRIIGFLATGGLFILISILFFMMSKLVVRFFAGKMAAIILNNRNKKSKKDKYNRYSDD